MTTLFNLMPLAIVLMMGVAIIDGTFQVVKDIKAKRAARAYLSAADDPFLTAMIPVNKGRGLTDVEYATTRERVFELLAGALTPRQLALVKAGLFQNHNNARNDFLWDLLGR